MDDFSTSLVELGLWFSFATMLNLFCSKFRAFYYLYISATKPSFMTLDNEWHNPSQKKEESRLVMKAGKNGK